MSREPINLRLSIGSTSPPMDTDRMSEHHVGIRFGDGPTRDTRWEVTLDGVRVERWTIEALAGRPGWVLVVGQTLFECEPVCVHGDVTIAKVPIEGTQFDVTGRRIQ